MVKVKTRKSLRFHNPASLIRSRSTGFPVPNNYTELAIRVHLHTLTSQACRAGRPTASRFLVLAGFGASLSFSLWCGSGAAVVRMQPGLC